MERRDFLTTMALTGAAASSSALLLPGNAEAANKVDIGEVKNVKIDVLSETSWFNNDNLKKSIVDYGGASTNQYTIPWDAENAGGYSALITVTTLDGKDHKILMDSGWSNPWMDYVFEMHGIPKMLSNGEIEFMVLTHWHLDHFWGCLLYTSRCV